jgi:plastocyanin
MWYALAVVIIIVIVIGAVVYFETRPKTSGSPLTLYEGEVSAGYGFGNTAATLTSNPGPNITLTAGTIYTMTVNNVGTMGHNWAIVTDKNSVSSVVWGAQIGSGTNPIAQGSSGSVTFTAGAAGTYYYVCQVSGHVNLGMWGTVIVNP